MKLLFDFRNDKNTDAMPLHSVGAEIFVRLFALFQYLYHVAHDSGFFIGQVGDVQHSPFLTPKQEIDGNAEHIRDSQKDFIGWQTNVRFIRGHHRGSDPDSSRNLRLRQMLVPANLLQSLRKINHRAYTPLLIVYTLYVF